MPANVDAQTMMRLLSQIGTSNPNALASMAAAKGIQPPSMGGGGGTMPAGPMPMATPGVTPFMQPGTGPQGMPMPTAMMPPPPAQGMAALAPPPASPMGPMGGGAAPFSGQTAGNAAGVPGGAPNAPGGFDPNLIGQALAGVGQATSAGGGQGQRMISPPSVNQGTARASQMQAILAQLMARSGGAGGAIPGLGSFLGR